MLYEMLYSFGRGFIKIEQKYYYVEFQLFKFPFENEVPGIICKTIKT